jgi:hypothetical protein
MKMIVVDHRRAYIYVLNASTYSVRELSMAGMSRGCWAWYIADFPVLLSAGIGDNKVRHNIFVGC